MATEKFVENDAETVNIARRRHGFAADLFRAGVFGRHYALEGEGLTAALRVLRVEQLGDAEVEQLWFALGGDANIRRLDVAMNDQMLVRVSDGGADLAKKLEPLFRRQLALIAILIQPFALDVFHGEKMEFHRR